MNRTIRAAALVIMAVLLAVLVPSPTLSAPTLYGACVGAAVLFAAALTAALRRKEKAEQGRVDILELALFSVPAALVCARLVYCLIQFSFYFLEMGPMSVLRVWEGGFLLYGAAAGAMGASALLAKRRGADVALTLDEMAAPGMLVIMISRLAEAFTTEGVGVWIESEHLMRFPFAVLNDYGEWQLCVFLPEAAAAAVILLIVLRKAAGKGERIMTALLLYACCQVFFESLRMDDCLKIGFVRVSQVASAAVIAAVTAIRAYRAGGRTLAAKRVTVVLSCVAVCGGIEWALDKTPMNNILLYAVMIAMCAVMMANGTRLKKTE